MTRVVVDDYLLRNLLAGKVSDDFSRIMAAYEPATTNLYLLRLCRSVVGASGGKLTGSLSREERQDLERKLIRLPKDIEILPIRILAYRMGELILKYRLLSLGAEAVAAAEYLDAPLCVWAGNDGPGIRAAVVDIGGNYLTVSG